jgi:hypothetical protein
MKITGGKNMEKIIPSMLIGILIISSIGAGASFSVHDAEGNQQAVSMEYSMVIIAPEQFSSAIQPLIDHKNSVGVTTFLKTTEEIYASYDGRDQAEQIKYFIKDALETSHIKYVLLIGGRKGQLFDWYVPVRYVNLDDGSAYTTFISDLYFADIYKIVDNDTVFEDWDSNGNGIFAEFSFISKDDLDLHPDICIGRLPCRNVLEVRIVVKKIIDYETSAYEAAWFNNMVIVAGDTFFGYTGYEGEATGDVAASYMTGFNIEKLYASTGVIDSADDVIQAVTAGCGFLFTRCRGGTDRIRLPLLDGTELIVLHNRNISQLKNNHMYPICVLGECWHGMFDVTILNLIKLLKNDTEVSQSMCVPECIAWRLVRKNNGGAIATLTNTNTCYGAIGDTNHNDILDDAELYGGKLAVDVFRFYGEEHMDILGEIHAATVNNYVDNYPVHTDKIHCKSVEEWILVGDPSLKIGGYS